MNNKNKDKKEIAISKHGYVSVRKGNQVIQAKFKGTLLENQLIAIGTARLPVDGSSFTVKIYPEELQRLIKRQDNHGLYNRLKTAAQNMTTGYSFFMEKDGNFGSYALIKSCVYEDGVFEIRFNDDLKDSGMLGKLKTNYTAYPLANVLNFESPYSFRIYEIIRSYAWKCHDDSPAVVRYDIDELKCMIGIVDINDPDVRKYIQQRNWSEAVKAAKYKTYERWDNFKNKVLDKAMIEIKGKSDYYFDYNLERGHGGKYQTITFIIRKNKKISDELEDELKIVEGVFNGENPEFEFCAESLPKNLSKYIGHNKLSEEDLKTFYAEAEKDEKLVEEAILLADKKSMSVGYVIENYPGWIRACIRNGGYDDQMVSMGSAERGEQIKEIKEELENLNNDEDKQADLLAGYWTRAKEGNSEKFREFVDYVEKNDMTLDMFEMIHPYSECGDILIEFTKNKKVDLIGNKDKKTHKTVEGMPRTREEYDKLVENSTQTELPKDVLESGYIHENEPYTPTEDEWKAQIQLMEDYAEHPEKYLTEEKMKEDIRREKEDEEQMEWLAFMIKKAGGMDKLMEAMQKMESKL